MLTVRRYAAGAISRESAWKLAYDRGVCSQRLAAKSDIEGAMVSVGLSQSEADNHLRYITEQLGCGDLVVACENSPTNVTVSGRREHVEALAARLEQESIFVRLLKVPVAYHGPHMNLIADSYLQSIGTIDAGASHPHAHTNMVSSVTGERVSSETLRDPAYWVRNMVSPVKFLDSVRLACAERAKRLPNKLDLSHRDVPWTSHILEIGPHATLSGPIRDTLRELVHGNSISYIPTLIRKRDSRGSFLSAVAQLHCAGYQVSLSKLNLAAQPGLSRAIALTDLPNYPFDHTQSFWWESRISRGIRFREFARNLFLGSPVPDWNPLDARWRHILKPNDSSWIHDHKINGRTIFPAAGMLTMAIEAAAQLAGGAEVFAFEISDAIFHSALELSSNSEGVEVQLQMTPHKSTQSRIGPKYKWCLRVYQTEWNEVSRGVIRTIHRDTSSNEIDRKNEESYLSARTTAHFDAVSRRCIAKINGSTLYARLWHRGYHFGPSFARIKASKHSSSGEATAKVAILETQGSESPAVVHPATLDGILQIMLPGVTQGGQETNFSTHIPTRINKMWISKDGLLRKDADSVHVAVKIQKTGFRNTTSDIAALSQDKALRVLVERIETTSIGDGLDALPTPSTATKRLCWNMVYKPDIDRLDPAKLEELLSESEPAANDLGRYFGELDIVLYTFLQDAQQELAESELALCEGHLNNYYRWMKKQLENRCVKAAHLDGNPQGRDAFKRIHHRVRNQHPKISKIYYRAGEELKNILGGHSDPLGVLFQDNDMPDFYECVLEFAAYMVPLGRYLDLLTHKNPSLTVLEVGAGTGGATKHIMKTLARPGSSGYTARYSRYCFTDISPSFFGHAQNFFGAFPNMDYQTFNIEQDPLDQGFESESFDLIIASLVLHATSSLDETLANLRKLLKPGGKLVAMEVTAPDGLVAGFVFGLLPGWWLSKEKHRQERLSPCLTPEEWHEVLISNGFSGVDHVFWDTQDEEHRLLSLLVSTKLDTEPSPEGHEVLSALIAATPGVDSDRVELCQELLKSSGAASTRADLTSISIEANLSSQLLIVFDNPVKPLLQSLSASDFANLRQCLSRASNILWVSSIGASHSNPCTSTIYGLARTLRSENALLNFTVFEAPVSSPLETQRMNFKRVIRHCLSPSRGLEPEIVEKNGVLQIPRVEEDVHLNEQISEQDAGIVQRNVVFGDGNLRLTVQTPGLLDSLRFVQGDTLPQDLGPGEVEVRVKAVGVNFKDCLVALGRVSDDTLGTECAGIVERAGSACSVSVGDRVMVAALDTYRSTIRCEEALVAKLPDGIGFLEAAKVPTNFVTAYHALIEVGRLTEGESVLIHAGAGGTGQAAIQIAQHIKAEVFVTVGSQHKKELVMSTYGIPDGNIFYSRDASFAHGIRRRTGGRGVDLILNSLAGDELRASWGCIAPYGRFLEIGKRDIFSHEKLPMFQFAKNVSFSAVDIAAMTRERPRLIQKALAAVVNLLARKQISVASPLRVFPIHEVEDAFRYLQSGLNAGCAAIDVDQNAIVPVSLTKKSSECLFRH